MKEITNRIVDFQFDMITARLDKKLPKFERVGNVNVYRLGFGLKTLDKFLLPFLGLGQAARQHKKEPYNIVWSIMASQASIAAARFKKHFPGVKLLLTLQEGDEEEHLKRYVFGVNFLYKLLIQPWHLLVFRRADHMTAISNYLKERALTHGVKIPVEIVPNAVDTEKFQINSKFQFPKFKTDLGIKEGDKIIITTSRLVEKNAVGDIIDAMLYLPENIRLVIIGRGELEEKLKLKTKNLKLQDRVLFLGNVPNEQVPEYLAISDAFVRPSLSEGLGNSFLEAMAAGVPIIGTNVGGIPDFLTDAKTGLFCEVGSPRSIADKVKLLLTDDDLRQKVVANAKKLVAEKYDWSLTAVKMAGIFDKICES